MSNDYNPYGNSGQSFPPYGDFYAPPRKSGSRIWLWIVGIVVVLGGGSVLICCCGLGYLGLEAQESDLKLTLRDHPVVQEQLGEIQEVNRNWSASVAAQEKDDEDVWVFDVKGTKGSGEITATYDDEQNLKSAQLRSSDGKTFELF